MTLERLNNAAPRSPTIDALITAVLPSEDSGKSAPVLSAEPNTVQDYVEPFSEWAATDVDDTGSALEDIPRAQLKADFAAQRHVDVLGRYMYETGKVPLLKAEEEVELAKDIEVGLYAQYRLAADTDDTPAHTRRELLKIVRQGEKAKDRFISSNLRLVVALARRPYAGDLPLLDVIQEGNLGLIRAVEKFDYTKGYKFSTYATWWIWRAIDCGIKDERGGAILIPRGELESMDKVSKANRDLTQVLGREPRPQEVAKELGMSTEEVLARLPQLRPTASLDAPVYASDESTVTLGDNFVEVAAEEDERVLALLRESTYSTLQAALTYLDDSERQVLAIWASDKKISAAELGRRISAPTAAAQALLKQSLAKLSHPVMGLTQGPDDSDDAWKLEGVCREIGFDAFFPKPGDYNPKVIEACGACLVRKTCLEFAVTNAIRPGIWGGTRMSERWKIAKQAKRKSVLDKTSEE